MKNFIYSLAFLGFVLGSSFASYLSAQVTIERQAIHIAMLENRLANEGIYLSSLAVGGGYVA